MRKPKSKVEVIYNDPRQRAFLNKTLVEYVNDIPDAESFVFDPTTSVKPFTPPRSLMKEIKS